MTGACCSIWLYLDPGIQTHVPHCAAKGSPAEPSLMPKIPFVDLTQGLWWINIHCMWFPFPSH